MENSIHMYFIKTMVVSLLMLPTASKVLGQQDTLKVTKDEFQLIRKTQQGCFYIRDNKVAIDCPENYTSLIHENVLKKTSAYYLEVYYDQDFNNLYSEGLAYSHCFISDYKAYHQNGQMKAQGQFQKIEASNIDEQCNQKIGEWLIYDSTGTQVRKERWEKGEYTGEYTWGYLEVWNIELLVNGQPYRGEEVAIDSFKSFDIKLYRKDRNLSYGRYECTLLLTGGKTPLGMQKIDYTALKYFDLKQYLNLNWQQGSDLHITVRDNKTGIYFATKIKLNQGE